MQARSAVPLAWPLPRCAAFATLAAMIDARPICHVVAGPNGSGKSTFALRYLPRWAGAVEYVNPDLIAQGDSPLDIRLSAYEAAKRTLTRIRELIARGGSFAFETTLSGRGQFAVMEECRQAGFELVLDPTRAADMKKELGL